MGKFIDLTNKKFNRLTVMYRCMDEKYRGKRVYWHCRCDCGNEVDVSRSNLTSNQVTSCGCARAGSKIYDLSNRRFGRLEALYYVKLNKHNQAIWHCKCDCGNEKDIIATNLLLGKAKSCGCLAKELTSIRSCKEMIGKRFGSWVVISRDYIKQSKSFNKKVVFWKCKCDCGNIRSISATSLRHGDTNSCGCSSISFSGSIAENEIHDFVLDCLDNNIEVIKAHRILDGKEIDIYIPSMHFGIEYNGSAFHASSNSIFSSKPKYYHRNKFLCAKEQGIRLISIFDIDYKNNKDEILKFIKDILTNNEKHFIPTKDIIYTDNDFDNGEWLKSYGYKEAGQEEPAFYTYSSNNYKVYRSGYTKWRKIPR